MDRKLKGRVAEAKAVAHFIENGYEVFMPFSDNGAVDMIVVRDDVVSRVSVKYTSKIENSKFRVNLTQVYRNGDGSTTTATFKAEAIDLLAVYIGPEDRISVIEASSITAKWALAIA